MKSIQGMELDSTDSLAPARVFRSPGEARGQMQSARRSSQLGLAPRLSALVRRLLEALRDAVARRPPRKRLSQAPLRQRLAYARL